MEVMMANSKQIYVAADHTKFDASASVELGNITEIDALFTDQAPPPPCVTSLPTADEVVTGE